MKKFLAIGVATAGLCTLSLNAHAELQTWRFTGNVDRKTIDFVTPDWLSEGRTVVIDYEMDMGVPLSYSDFYNGAIVSVSFNGSKFAGDGYVFALENALFGLNTSLDPAQTGGIDFLSFGVLNSPSAGPDLRAVLTSVSQIVSGIDYLRVDFGNDAGVYLLPQSFVALPVPEPDAVPLALVGVLLLAYMGKRVRKMP